MSRHSEAFPSQRRRDSARLTSCAISCWILLSPTHSFSVVCKKKKKSKCKGKTLQNTTKKYNPPPPPTPKNNCKRKMLQFPETKSKSASTLGGTGPETSVLWGKSLCKDISQHALKKFSFLLRGGTKMYS